MTRHYHVIECPHCNRQHQRSCSLDNCTTAIVSLELFTSSDGHKPELVHCLKTDEIFYIDFGDRNLEAENVQVS